MFTQNKKKFHIIGSNPKDFFDMTIEGTEALLKSDIVILSKYFNKSFINFLTDNKKNFLFREDIAKEGIKLYQEIFSFFKKYNSLSYLISGDPYFNYKNDLEDFFKKKNINVIKITGILEIADWVNRKKDFLTNREKNSSIFFYIPSSIKEVKNILRNSLCGKVVIIVKAEKLLNTLIEKLYKESKIKYKIYVNGNRRYGKNLPFKLESQFSSAYVIIDCE
ncbi:MAG: hypothetical protein VX009_02545 [Pseudomonadota bacterium]|nr:hypothetical protein [Pseudomonadota bacterium]